MNRILLVALPAAMATLAGCAGSSSPVAGGSPAGSPSPSPSVAASASPSASAVVLDYNLRLGSNRFAAEAALTVGRQLYSQGGQYWEVNVRTDPLTLAGVYDPVAQPSPAQVGGGAKAVTVFMATESAGAIKLFRAGGVDHEKAEITQVGVLLGRLFPGASTVTVQVFFGESSHYATATYSAGRLDYQVLIHG